MTATYVDIRGRQPYIKNDTTRSWVESIGRKDGLIRPQVVLRVATDTNHIRNATRTLYNSPHQRRVHTQSIMNNALPGQKIPGLLHWSVTESLNQITQSAQFECTNCLPLSNVTTTVTSKNPAGGTANDGIGTNAWHGDTIIATWAQDSLFTIEKVTGPGGRDSTGNKNVEFVNDSFGVGFREANVKYRIFTDQKVQVADASKFPDPAIPDDDDNDVALDTGWARHANGAGAYFILVGNEVMRVCQLDRNTNTFHVPPGGRGINGVIQAHVEGETVTLLGHGKPTGEYCAMGYLAVDDFHSEKAILRPGTCIVSYEGYGDIVGGVRNGQTHLTHDYHPNYNYQFTGYWFVDTVEPALGEDGTPRVTVTLKSAGSMYENQKINIDTIQRMKNKFGQWNVKGKTLFSAAGATRNIPGDWVDYNSWDPTDQFSYPLQIKTEYAQHYAFFQHMQDTQNGLTCLQCHQELADYLKTHARETARDRPVGRHIYKESIRVLRENAGPIKTYIRLMATMAAAAWDHPAYGTELSQKFTKVPNQLFDNIRNIFTGLCYNGQLDFQLATADPKFDFTNPNYDDKKIISSRRELTCPFQSTYDNAPFSQPMLDLADINGCTFWVDRRGYPVFKPFGWNMRPEINGYKNLTSGSKPDKTGPRFESRPHHKPGYNGEWFLSYGGSLSSYSSNVARDQIITQAWVTASTAFDVDNSSNNFTITASGSGFDDSGNLIFYSPLGGHKQGVALTGGVQQVDTVTLDNQYFGLDWNTNPAGWGMVENESGVDITMDALPALYNGSVDVNTKLKGTHESVRRIQMTINFLLVRGYLDPLIVNGRTWFTIDVDGKYGETTKSGVHQMHDMLVGGAGVSGAHYVGGTAFAFTGLIDGWSNTWSNDRDAYGRASYVALREYFKTHAYTIKSDIWWYVRNGKTWDEYIAAITGLPIPFTKGHAPKPRGTTTAYDTPLYVIDDKALQKEIAKWYKTFAQSAINIGNRKVNQSVNQAVTRSVASNLADPRILPGDTIFIEIPGHLSATAPDGSADGPFNNGIYVTDIQRNMDLEQGTYTATYSGTRQQGLFGKGLTKIRNPKYDLITE